MVLDLSDTSRRAGARRVKRVRSLRRLGWSMCVWLVCVVDVAQMKSQQAAVADAAEEERPSFEVASVKPSRPDDRIHRWERRTDRFFIRNYTLRLMIRNAYAET